MKTKRYYGMLLMLTFVCTAFLACGGDDDNDSPVINLDNQGDNSLAVTGDVTNLTSFSVTLSGTANIEYADYIGIEYATNAEMNHSRLTDMGSSGQFSATINDLLPNYTYNYRTYIRINDKEYYGEVKSFTTKEVTLQESGAVDLGLSVKWAACNLGARTPEEYGNYFEWGELSEKKHMSYYDANKTTGSINSRFTDLGNDISGTQYDAARAWLGGSWRMPTKDEIQELIEKCSEKYLKYKGKEGVLFTASNGNRIFMPIAGIKKISHSDNKITMEDEGEKVEYWSSTIYETIVGPSISSAYTLYLSVDESLFDSFYDSVMMVCNGFLSEGMRSLYFLPIRPVTE